MGHGFTGSRWAGLIGAVLLGLLPAACDRPVPSGSAPAESNPATGDAPNSMALEADPQSPAGENDPLAPPPPPPGAFLAQLSPDQVAQLTSLGIDVVVPGTVPPAFQVADLRITQGDMGTSYLIVYQNASNQCFAVEYVDGGTLTPLATENRVPIKPPLFTDENGNPSYGLNYGKYSDPEWQAKFPEPNLYTDWLAGPSGYYRLTGAAEIKALFATFDACKDIDPQDAVAIAESFTLITTEPMGEMF
ncbi:MAG: hypothetical protein ACHWZW_10410 [Spirulina sp.]